MTHNIEEWSSYYCSLITYKSALTDWDAFGYTTRFTRSHGTYGCNIDSDDLTILDIIVKGILVTSVIVVQYNIILSCSSSVLKVLSSFSRLHPGGDESDVRIHSTHIQWKVALLVWLSKRVVSPGWTSSCMAKVNGQRIS